MTLTLAVNANNDLYIGPDGNLATATGGQAILIACKCVAQSQLREMVLQQNDGLPYFEIVWVGSPNLPLFQSKLRSAFLAIDGVASVTNLALKQSGDSLGYSATIEDTDGNVNNISDEVLPP